MFHGEKKKKKKANDAVVGTGPDPEWEKKWQVEEDLRAVARASMVQKDPARMAAVKALAKQKLTDSKNREEEAKAMVDLGEGKDV